MLSQVKVKTLLKVLIYLQIVVLAISFFFINWNWTLAGAWMGKLAIYTFWLIAIGGILQRLQMQGFWQKVRTIIIPNRRELGILMFLLSLSHFFWSKGFKVLLGITQSLPLFQVFGLLALLLATPLFLTSNNYSVRKLGKNWKKLHRLVYPIMFLLILHTAMQGRDFQIFGLYFGWEYTLSYALPSLVLLVLQIISLFLSFKR